MEENKEADKIKKKKEEEKKMEEEHFWGVDGGVFANNPSDIAYIDHLKLFPKEKCKVLSIGTGLAKSTFKPTKYHSLGGWDWLFDENIIDLLLDSNQVSSHMKTKFMTREHGDDYIRINEYLTVASIQMDDTTKANYDNLIKEGDLWWDKYKDHEFFKDL